MSTLDTNSKKEAFEAGLRDASARSGWKNGYKLKSKSWYEYRRGYRINSAPAKLLQKLKIAKSRKAVSAEVLAARKANLAQERRARAEAFQQYWESQIPKAVQLVEAGLLSIAAIAKQLKVDQTKLRQAIVTDARLTHAHAHRYIPALAVTHDVFEQINGSPLRGRNSIALAYVKVKIWVEFRLYLPWKLNFAEWWAIWEASGKWHSDPKQRDHCMLPTDRNKGWVVGNLYIAPRWASFELAGQLSVLRWAKNKRETLASEVYLLLNNADFARFNQIAKKANRTQVDQARYYLSFLLNNQVAVPPCQKNIGQKRGPYRKQKPRPKRHLIRVGLYAADYQRTQDWMRVNNQNISNCIRFCMQQANQLFC